MSHVETECQNCGRVVSERYARVFAPNEREGPRTCPRCALIRDGREVRAHRSDNHLTPDDQEAVADD